MATPDLNRSVFLFFLDPVGFILVKANGSLIITHKGNNRICRDEVNCFLELEKPHRAATMTHPEGRQCSVSWLP